MADHLIDARSQTGTAPDEKTEMRYPTRASELVHRRLQVPPSPLHDTSCTPTSRQYARRGIIVRFVLDLGHQRFPGDPSCAFAPLSDPGRTDGPSPMTVSSMLPLPPLQQRLQHGFISRPPRGFSTCCLRFKSGVATATCKTRFRLAG